MGVIRFPNAIKNAKWHGSAPTPSGWFPSDILPSTWLMYDDDGFNGQEFSDEDGDTVSSEFNIAPLPVHFFSNYAITEDTNNRFKDCYYVWDFGDDATATWGISGKYKNIEYGASVCHVYETPGTYTANLSIYDMDGLITTEQYTITVNDPDVIYTGTNTTCVCDSANVDFSEAPTGCNQVTTDDCATLSSYFGAGKRVLFHRGSSWTLTVELDVNNEAKQYIGAFGTGTGEDELGIYTNNPIFTTTGCGVLGVTSTPDLIVSDLICIGDKTQSAFSGAAGMRDQLFLRLQMTGYTIGIGWSHYNSGVVVEKNNIVISECSINDSVDYGLYGGAQRLALLGNYVADTEESHVVRVWQGYRANIRHNSFSGSSLVSGSGRHCLKLHGPGVYYDDEGNKSSGALGEEEVGSSNQNLTTRYVMVTDNLFGGCGPWPINIAPQNTSSDERLCNIILERNRYIANYGSQSDSTPNLAFLVASRGVSIRNNTIDCTGTTQVFRSIIIHQEGIEPTPKWACVFNNTSYREDASSDEHALVMLESVTDNYVINNLCCFPEVTGTITLVSESDTTDTYASENTSCVEADFVDPTNTDFLLRDFNLVDGASSAGIGDTIINYDDFNNTRRMVDAYDVGAYGSALSSVYELLTVNSLDSGYVAKPLGYSDSSSSETLYPLVIYMGAGSGTDVDSLFSAIPSGFAEGSSGNYQVGTYGLDYPAFYFVTNLCTGYDDAQAELDRQRINYLKDNYRIDPDRIYLAGYSAGGQACHVLTNVNYAIEGHDYAGIIRLSGGYNPEMDDNLICEWGHQGLGDVQYRIDNMELIYANSKLNRPGGTEVTTTETIVYSGTHYKYTVDSSLVSILSEYTDIDHADILDVWGSSDLMDWLFARRK